MYNDIINKTTANYNVSTYSLSQAGKLGIVFLALNSHIKRKYFTKHEECSLTEQKD